MEKALKEIAEAVIKGKAPAVKDLVQSCIDEGVSPTEIMDKGLIAGMDVVGKKFKAEELYLPEVMVAARAMSAGLALLDPILGSHNAAPKGTIALATVKGDVHDIGKNMVAMMFRGAGYKIVDLGVNVEEGKIVQTIRDEKPDILALSALLTLSLPNVKIALEALKEAGLRQKVITMVGGAPVTQEFADDIGADGYAPDAASAVERAAELRAERRSGE